MSLLEQNGSIQTLSYVAAFRCVGDQCPDSCCSNGWQIPLSLNEAKTLRRLGYASHVVPAENSDCRAQLRLEENGSCSFLKNGLCSFMLEQGASLLPHPCSTYPRDFFKLGSRQEITISLGCPEAARLFFQETGPLQWVDFAQSLPEILGFAFFDAPFPLAQAQSLRQKCLTLLDDRPSLPSALGRLLDLTYRFSLLRWLDRPKSAHVKWQRLQTQAQAKDMNIPASNPEHADVWLTILAALFTSGFEDLAGDGWKQYVYSRFGLATNRGHLDEDTFKQVLSRQFDRLDAQLSSGFAAVLAPLQRRFIRYFLQASLLRSPSPYHAIVGLSISQVLILLLGLDEDAELDDPAWRDRFIGAVQKVTRNLLFHPKNLAALTHVCASLAFQRPGKVMTIFGFFPRTFQQ